jgi:hypothetical protein
MKTYTFNTDRFYDGQQCITVTIDQVTNTDFEGFVDLDVIFHDASRHITGKAFIPMMQVNFTIQALQRSVMQSYDANLYDPA